ncbi:MAG TPA: hypothetical protein VL527_13260 [Dongiaceae bacterium]|nr:hypothetical protein [Dongiaceae bacterium]
MNALALPGFAADLARDLRAYLALCEEVLQLTVSENQSLAGAGDYQAFAACQRRKDLLPRLETTLMKLRMWRKTWQQTSPEERAGCAEVKSLFQSIQSLLMRVFMLDRENQQALLRRGLVPATHLPPAASQQPHYVAGLYRRHAGS